MSKFNKDGVENQFLPIDYQDHEDSIRSTYGEGQKADGAEEEYQEDEEEKDGGGTVGKRSPV